MAKLQLNPWHKQVTSKTALSVFCIGNEMQKE